MTRYVYLVTVNAMPGQEVELDRWLEEVHVPEVLRTEGFLSARRFELPPEEGGNAKGCRFMHYYEIETDDLERTKTALADGRADRSPIPPAMDLASVSAVYYRAR